jgi:chemotaxis protein methyltransferase CheR
VQCSPAEWDAFYASFYQRTKLDLHQYKADQMRRRIASMAEARACGNLAEFWRWLAASEQNLQWFQDKLAINISELFRNPEKWLELKQRILPELTSRNSGLRCWSAGCSYGAEAHSLAAILVSDFGHGHHILGTDIDQAALAQARNGQFSESDMKGVPLPYRKHFQKVGDRWQATDEVRKLCNFRTGDLLKELGESTFDLIICRNVVIYFTEEAKDKLYERFYRALKPGGVLFVGSTERIFNASAIGFETPAPFFYKRPNRGGEKQWRNAS